MLTSRFRLRLRLAVLLPTLAALLVGMPLVWALASDLLHESIGRDLARALPLAERALADHLAESPADLQSAVVDLGARSSIRVTVISADGRPLADSERDLEGVSRMDNHRSRPEVEEAARQGLGSALRHSATLDRDFLYVAKKLERGPESNLFLRLAEPITATGAIRHRLVRWVLLSSLASLLAMAAISLWLDRRLLKPLADIRRHAERLAQGDLGTRLEIPAAEEAAAIANVINQLAARVEQQIRTAEAERAHLLAVGESMADGILVTDADGRVRTVNLACRRLFRVRGEVEGRSVRKVTGVTEIELAVGRALASGESQSVEVELEHPASRTLSITCSVLHNQSGVVVAVRDITEFLLLGRIRRDLVANVSHEFKTPLTAIRGYAETLVDSALEDPAAARLFTERILQQCKRLQALLDDLLKLSRLERADEHVETEAIDLKSLLEEAAEVLAAAAQRKRVTIELDLDPISVNGSREALSELCLNLLDNAIKYNTADGKVTVRLRRRGHGVELEVRDTGYGIPEAAVPRVFERFYRVDRGRSREQGGTGLGLAIVKHAVEQHQGSIEVESRLGEGSTFRVRLPEGEHKEDHSSPP